MGFHISYGGKVKVGISYITASVNHCKRYGREGGVVEGGGRGADTRTPGKRSDSLACFGHFQAYFRFVYGPLRLAGCKISSIGGQDSSLVRAPES